MSLRHPAHRKVAPETPCEGCGPNRIADCGDNSRKCKAWKVYERFPTGKQKWTAEQRGVFR